MLIIEGPEGSGKSKLAQFLRDNSRFEVHHFGPPPADPNELEHRLEKSQALLSLPIIQDRSSWVSEPIYSVLLGTGPVSTWPAYVEGLKSMRAKVIYCRPPEETIKESMCRSPKVYKNATYERRILLNADRLISLYDEFMEQLNPWLRYDWTLESGRLVEKRLVRLLERWWLSEKKMGSGTNNKSGGDTSKQGPVAG